MAPRTASRSSRPDLSALLAGTDLPALWLVTGEEPLLMIEAANAIRARARELGYAERTVINAASNAEWDRVLTACREVSLFSPRQIVEVRLASFRPGTKGAAVLTELAQTPLEGTIVIVSLPYDWSIAKVAWFTKLSAAAQVLQFDPVTARSLPMWLKERLARADLQIEPDALQRLAGCCEGNLLAASQEVLKLSYAYPKGTTLTLEMIDRGLTDLSRYSVTELMDAAMRGDAARAARIVAGLEATGEAIPAFLWLITDDIRQAIRVRSLMDERHLSGLQAASELRVWPQDRRQRVQAVVARASTRKLANALSLCADIDRLSKGLAVKDRNSSPWSELTSLVTFLAG